MTNFWQKTSVDESTVVWLEALMADWQLIADLAFADLVMWVPTKEGFIAAGHARPSSAATRFYRDITGNYPQRNWEIQIELARKNKAVSTSAGSRDYDNPDQLTAIPVISGDAELVAVITRHTSNRSGYYSNKLEQAYLSCANDLLNMVASGDFPNRDAGTGPRRGAPRANDGLIRVDAEGRVTFASPNALSAFNRAGIEGELEGEILAELAVKGSSSLLQVDEGLPLVLSAKDSWRSDLSTLNATVSIRSIPLKKEGERIGGLILVRDVTQLRDRERELITKDVTIREIHHRVKNNLQTVSSLLKIQARKSDSEEVKNSLQQALRRVNSIGLVHEALSEVSQQNVEFDSVFQQILRLVGELFASYHATVETKIEGQFGVIPSERATPLAIALTEIVSNAVEHGLRDRSGVVTVTVSRDSQRLDIEVTDDGIGMPEGKEGSGLGTQIIRSLVEGELRGTITWTAPIRGGTRVKLSIPY